MYNFRDAYIFTATGFLLSNIRYQIQDSGASSSYSPGQMLTFLSIRHLQHPPCFLLPDICSSQACVEGKAKCSRCARKLNECHDLEAGRRHVNQTEQAG